MWTQETIESKAAAYTHLVSERYLKHIPEDKLPIFIYDAFLAGCRYIIDNIQKQQL